jgi:peptide/nickel transport system permease protein
VTTKERAIKGLGEAARRTGALRPGESQWRIAWLNLRRDATAMAGLAGILLLVLISVLAPVIAPYDPIRMDFKSLLVPPSRAHLWGTDDLGRDTLTRVLWGGRESMRVAAMATAVAMIGGVLVGLMSGFYGGWIDTLVQRIIEVFMAFPTFLLLLAIIAALGPNLTTVLIALGIATIPQYARLVRGSVLSAKNREYVTAARLVGASNGRLMFRHVLPNVVAPVIVYSTLRLGSAIMLTTGLSYIGLGAQPPSPEWGAMLNHGRMYLRDAWWMSVFPGLAIFWAVLSVNMLGDGLRDALDPRLRER